ncbi:MAG: hypothetical protein PHU25_16865 [Deltaproteobacteria bacterium]|nr:hypothetical protein [Deltaproteobacteria bacterium]
MGGDRRGGARRIAPVILGFAVILGGFAVMSAHFRRVGLMAADESFYAVAARNVMRGELPYRDFAYTQMPLFPYIDGAILKIVGFSMEKHRMVSAIAAALGVAIIVLALRSRLGTWEPGFVAAFAAVAAPCWAFVESLGVWFGITTLLVGVAFAAAVMRGAFRPRAAVFAAASVAAVGCRLTCAFVCFFLWLAMIEEARGRKDRTIIAALPVGLGLIAYLPFFLAAPGNAFFLAIDYHLGSQLMRRGLEQATEWMSVAPTAIFLLVAALFGVAGLVRRRLWNELLVLCAGLAAVTVPMIPQSAWGVYVVAGVPAAAGAAVIAIASSGFAAKSPFRFAVWIVPIVTFFLPWPYEVEQGACEEVKEVARFLENEVPPGPILTPVPVVAVQAGREIVHGTEMGMFSAMGPAARDAARRVHMTTVPDLIEALDAQEPAAVVWIREPPPWVIWNFAWKVPQLTYQPADAYGELLATLDTCYEVVKSTETFDVMLPRE